MKLVATLKYIAQTGLSREDGSRICEVGDVCPNEVVEASPWLLKQGLVIIGEADEQKEATEGALQGDPSDQG